MLEVEARSCAPRGSSARGERRASGQEGGPEHARASQSDAAATRLRREGQRRSAQRGVALVFDVEERQPRRPRAARQSVCTERDCGGRRGAHAGASGRAGLWGEALRVSLARICQVVKSKGRLTLGSAPL